MTEHELRKGIGAETPALIDAKQVDTILNISSRAVHKLVRERRFTDQQVQVTLPPRK